MVSQEILADIENSVVFIIKNEPDIIKKLMASDRLISFCEGNVALFMEKGRDNKYYVWVTRTAQHLENYYLARTLEFYNGWDMWEYSDSHFKLKEEHISSFLEKYRKKEEEW